MQHQTTYYRTVPVSELPKKGTTDYYHVITTSGWLRSNYFNGQVFEDQRLNPDIKEWLEPIPMPDAAVLREALEKIVKDVSAVIPERIPVDDKLLVLLYNVKWTAQQALSAVGDGWVRIDEYDVPMVKHISNSHWITDGEDVYLAYKAGDRWFSKEDKVLPSNFTPTHIRPHTKPLPPQPINK